MARKVIYKENGFLNSPSTPTGYKYLGYDGVVLSEKTGATISAISGNVNTTTTKTIWVDLVYGDDGTAINYDFTKPYQTISSAVNAAVSGDMIYLRPGNYGTGRVILKDGINFYAEPGVTIGGLDDNSVSVICNFYGYANVNRGIANDCLVFRGTTTKIYAEFRDIFCYGATFINGSNSSYEGDIYIKCKRIYGNQTNPIISRPWGTSNFKFRLDVLDVVEVGGPSSTINNSQFLLLLQNTNAGYIELNINKYRVINNPSTVSGMLVFANNNNGAITTNLKIRITEVIMEYDNASHNSYAFIDNFSGNPSAWNLDLEIEKPFTLLRRGFLASYGTAINKVNANVTAKEVLVLNNGSTGSKLKIYNSVIKRNDIGSDLNQVITSANDGHLMELDNTIIIKESLGTDTSALINLSGTASKTQIKNCEIYLFGSTGSVADAPTVLDGEIYFKNTYSNIDLSVNITDISSLGGFIPNDTLLNSFDL